MILLKLIGIIFLVLSVHAYACNSPAKIINKQDTKAQSMERKNLADSSILDSLLKVVSKQFIGKTIDSFLQAEVVNKYKEYIFVDEPPGRLSYLILKYSESVYIEVEASNYKYMNPFNKKRKWYISLFRKEKVKRIRVIYNNKIVEQIE